MRECASGFCDFGQQIHSQCIVSASACLCQRAACVIRGALCVAGVVQRVSTIHCAPVYAPILASLTRGAVPVIVGSVFVLPSSCYVRRS